MKDGRRRSILWDLLTKLIVIPVNPGKKGAGKQKTGERSKWFDTKAWKKQSLQLLQ